MSREDEPTYATAAALAGVASEVESLRRRTGHLHELPGRVQQLADLLDELSGRVQQLTAQNPEPPPSWLMLPADADFTRQVLDELTVWLHQVLLRYADVAAALPECWVWHPDVVEELLWLMHAWLNAYQGRKASVSLVGDWHDRQRPGVTKRIRHTVGSCSLENHTPATGPASVPSTEALDPIAEWWAERRDEPAPEPTAEQLAATPRRRTGGSRR